MAGRETEYGFASHQDAERLRQLYVTYAQQFPDYCLTLATNRNRMPLDVFHSRVRDFHKLLDRKLLGPRSHRKPASERTNGIMFVEHIRSNVHGHACVVFAGDKSHAELQELCSAIWLKLCPGGSALVQRQYGEPALYYTKEMERLGYDDLQQAILFSTFVSG